MKPEPQPRDVICSVCALPWPDHQHAEGVEVGLEECVRLLKIELAKRPLTRTIWSGGLANAIDDFAQGGVVSRPIYGGAFQNPEYTS